MVDFGLIAQMTIPPLIVAAVIGGCMYRPFLRRTQHNHEWSTVSSDYDDNARHRTTVLSCSLCSSRETRTDVGPAPHQHYFRLADRTPAESGTIAEFACIYCGEHQRWDDPPTAAPHSHLWIEGPRSADGLLVVMKCACGEIETRPMTTPPAVTHQHLWRKASTEWTNGYERQIFTCQTCDRREIREMVT